VVNPEARSFEEPVGSVHVSGVHEQPEGMRAFDAAALVPAQPEHRGAFHTSKPPPSTASV
jgi:hypothetical protein